MTNEERVLHLGIIKDKLYKLKQLCLEKLELELYDGLFLQNRKGWAGQDAEVIKFWEIEIEDIRDFVISNNRYLNGPPSWLRKVLEDCNILYQYLKTL